MPCTVKAMAKQPHFIPIEELEAMTPDGRAAVFRERTVKDLNDLPQGFRDRIIENAQRREEQRQQHG